jgi:hypothetical protein
MILNNAPATATPIEIEGILAHLILIAHPKKSSARL